MPLPKDLQHPNGTKVLVRLITDGTFGKPFQKGQIRTGIVAHEGAMILVRPKGAMEFAFYTSLACGDLYKLSGPECEILRTITSIQETIDRNKRELSNGS